MDLFTDVKTLPTSETFRPVRLYLEAQARKDFSNAAEFFAENLLFNGLVLRAEGRERVAAEVQGFVSAAVDHIVIEAIAEVESGDRSRFLALYKFKLKPATELQFLCDHIVVEKGLITRIDNVFDLGKLPPM